MYSLCNYGITYTLISSGLEHETPQPNKRCTNVYIACIYRNRKASLFLQKTCNSYIFAAMNNIPRKQRLCRHCPSQVRDEKHNVLSSWALALTQLHVGQLPYVYLRTDAKRNTQLKHEIYYAAVATLSEHRQLHGPSVVTNAVRSAMVLLWWAV